MRLPTVSGAGTWLECHASHQAQMKYPRLDNTKSQAQLEGLSCHLMLEELIEGKELIVDSIDPKWGIVRTQELIDAVNKAYEVLPKVVEVEEKIDLSFIYPGWYGKIDISHQAHGILNVYDVKFGHSYVKVEENPQLMAYAIGKAHQLNLPSDHTVILHIIQPREYRSGEHFWRTWSTTVGELYNYIPMFKEAIENAMSKVPTARTGPQCKYCSARSNCNALRDVAYDVIDFSDHLSTTDLNGDQIGVDLKLVRQALERLKYFETSLEEQAVHNITNGKNVKGWGLIPQLGSLKWKRGVDDQVVNIAKMYGVDATKTTLITPRQLENLNVDKSVISLYTEQTSSMKLVEQSANDIAKLFNE